MRTVEELMTRKLLTMDEDQTLREAMAMMQRHRVRHLPVMKGGRLSGILTDRDVKRATPSLLTGVSQEEFDRVLSETSVSHVMTRNPYTVTPSTSLKDAVKILIDRRFSSLPVVEANKLVGILTITDLLRALHETLED
ncbi:MAG TPA: CBS domain-containing protein [Candidatus Polarisedimenticolia bacterium]|jgi:acetoin utilization protein AcuB